MSKKPSLRSSYDVIVVGSGAAGCSAAISAHLNGAKRVLVAEKSDRMVGYVMIYSELKNTKRKKLMKREHQRRRKNEQKRRFTTITATINRELYPLVHRYA